MPIFDFIIRNVVCFLWVGIESTYDVLFDSFVFRLWTTIITNFLYLNIKPQSPGKNFTGGFVDLISTIVFDPL